MKPSSFSRYIVSTIVAAALLAACGGAQNNIPQSSTVVPQASLQRIPDMQLANGGAFSGSYAGTYKVSGSCNPFMTFTYNAKGTSSFLGPSHEHGTITDFLANTPEGPHCVQGGGRFVLRSSSNLTNKIYIKLGSIIGGGNNFWDYDYTVAGGAGKFAKASGSGTVTITWSGNTYSDKYSGTLSF